MGQFTSENARDMQERSAAVKREKKAKREKLDAELDIIVDEITAPCDSLKDLAQRVKNTKGLSHLARVYLNDCSDPKKAMDAIKDIMDRVVGKPKQAEPTQIDITTGGKAFAGFSSVLPSMPGVEEICAKIDEEREKQNSIDE